MTEQYTSQYKQLQRSQDNEVLANNDEQEEGEDIGDNNGDDDGDDEEEENNQISSSDQYEQTLTNQPHDPHSITQTPPQQSPSQQLQLSNNSTNPHNHTTTIRPQHKKSSLLIQLTNLQSRLFHQIILKTQLNNQPQQNKHTIKKLATPIEQRISESYEQIQMLEGKLQSGLLMSHMQRRQVKEKILQKRMHELADVRVLCNLYRHHDYRLLLSLLHITLLYQDLDCHQQALKHLQTMQQINSKYRTNYIDAEYMQAMILTLMALSGCEMQRYNQSIGYLNEAIQIQGRLKQEGYEVKEFFTLNLTAKVFTGSKDYNKAIQFATMALQSAHILFTQNSLQSAQAYKSLAEAESASSQFPQALQHITNAIHILQHSSPQKQQLIIQHYTKLTEITFKQLNSMHLIEQQADHFVPFIDALRRKYRVIENTFGYRDKRAIKDKRHLASYLLKYQRVDQAEEELEDILEIEQTVYGEKSVEVAKTFKMLGTIAMGKNQTVKAEKLLRKSMGIFHDQGEVGLQKQVQSKILILTGKGRFINTRP